MSNFNRRNPFLYTLDATNQKLVTDIQLSIKDWIIQGCIGAITVMTSIIYWGLYRNPQYISIVLCIGLFLFTLIEIKRAVKESDTVQIDIMKYGNDNGKNMMGYSYINNEELFVKVTQITTQCGKVQFIRESIYVFDFIELFILVVNILHILIFIFK